MAIAASLNVNLTATSGAFTATMTKAGSTLEKLGRTATSINRGFQGVVAFTGLKKGINFVTSAIGDIDKLKASAAGAGFAVSDVDSAKLSGVQKVAEQAGGAFDAMKLQLLVGLAPAIEFVSESFRNLSTMTIGGFGVMETAGKVVGGVVIVIGKIFKSVYLAMRTGINGLQFIVAKLAAGAAKALDAVGATDKAREMRNFAAVMEKAVQMQGAELNKEWGDVFSWPEAKTNLSSIKAGAVQAAKEVKAITAPESITAGSQASAMFDFKRRAAAIQAKKDPGQQAADKQVGLLGGIDRKLARLIQLQGETTVVNA